MKHDQDWLLERIRLGEVPPHLKARAEEALRDPACLARLRALEEADALDRSRHPASAEVAEIRRIAAAQARLEEAQKRAQRKRRWAIGVPATALALCLAAIPWNRATTQQAQAVSESAPVANPLEPAVSSRQPPTPKPQPMPTVRLADGNVPAVQPDAEAGTGSQTTQPLEGQLASASGVRSKGEPLSLFVHRRTQGHAQRLFDGDSIHPGDMLQLSLLAEHPQYVWILSRDASGEITTHLPESGLQAGRIDTGLHALPHAWELDASSGFERFWIVWSQHPFALKDLERRLRTLPRDAVQLPLPAGFSQRSLRFPKGPR